MDKMKFKIKDFKYGEATRFLEKKKKIVLPFWLHYGVFKFLYKYVDKKKAIKWIETFD